MLVPLIGVAALTAAVTRTRMSEAASAARAEAAVRAVAQLSAARSGVEHEVIPALSLAVLADPAASELLGLGPFVGQLQRTLATGATEETRAATDEALARVPAGSQWSTAAARASERLAGLRRQADAGTVPLDDLYDSYLDISDELTRAQAAAAEAATAEKVSVPTYRATRDVELVAQLAQDASRQMPLFLGTQLSRLVAGETAESFRAEWEIAWVDYTDARRRMEDLSQPALRAAWERVQTTPVFARVDGLLAARAEGADASTIPMIELIGLVNQALDRDAVLTEFLEDATDTAQDLATVDHARAHDLQSRTLLLGGALLLASVLGALLLGRMISRTLRVLAARATQVSEGSLVEVEIAGPREVRTVSTALDATVASLRRIQDQAEAVARGDLADPVLDQPLSGRLGEVVHASVRQIVHAVRQREELQSALAHQATHDPLTALPNRAQALRLVTSALHRAQRSGQMTGLLFVDLDGFKGVNDSHGHASGDEVLREVARRMTAVVRPGDVVGRLGGDEFVVLVEQVALERDLLDLAERLIGAVSAPIDAAGQQVRIGASVGVAVSRDAGTDADALVAEADTAAYRAKRRGRGRAEMFDEALRLQLTAHAELEAAIAYALANDEMQLHYQPVVDVARDRLIGYEALVRWERPGHGMVRPDAFIPVAESSGLICDLDRWVLGAATRQLAEWRADTPADQPEPTVAVNISGRHLTDPRIVEDVADALEASGLPARLLTLEVTETVLVSDPAAIDNLAALRDLGVAIAIDDFGTGYTSIGQLGHMPVDTLKIDRSFIASTDPGHRELVALMIRAAHTFGLTVVAEGVEEEDQLARLKADACDQAQGYLLYRPMTAADAGALLRPVELLATD
ncbi:EAL domain-containing protein [Blastococcus deserti]|uniref:EAL domain-containing protein n=1 Tax=Blastococcus deserti TaxID=2259033 RepID=A0ABW4X3M9_9ACTN